MPVGKAGVVKPEALGAFPLALLDCPPHVGSGAGEFLGIEAARYIGFAVDIMEFNSIRRFEIDWAEFRAATLEDAGNARTPARAGRCPGHRCG